MVEDFSKKVLGMLSSRFGTLLGQSYFDLAKFKLQITDFDKMTDSQEKSFIDFIASYLYRDDSPEIFLRKKSYLYYTFFNDNSELEFQPSLYIPFNFGDKLSKEVMSILPKTKGKSDIFSFDEQKQVELIAFMIMDMFEQYGDSKVTSLLEEFASFVMTKEHVAKDIVTVLKPESGYDIDSSVNLISAIHNYLDKITDGKFNGLMDSDLNYFLNKMGVNGINRSLYYDAIRTEIDSKDIAIKQNLIGKDRNITIDVKSVLSEFINSNDAELAIQSALQSLNSKDLSLLNSGLRKAFIEFILTNTLVSKFSTQKRNLLRDKLKRIML